MPGTKPSTLPRVSPWILALVAATALLLAVFAANSVLGDVRSGNAWGLSYGAAAALLLVASALYGVRRRTMRISTRIGAGPARLWLPLHTLVGTLFLLLVLMHSGFRLPEGWVTWGLWLLSFWTVASGLFGLVLQRWIPRKLTSGLSLEVHYDRIPELVTETRARADKLAESCGETVRGFYERRVERVFRGPRWRWLYFVDAGGGIRSSLREFDFLAERLAGEERARLEELRLLMISKSEMDAHYTLQSALRAWLYLHVPATAALLGLLAIHLFTIFYY